MQNEIIIEKEKEHIPTPVDIENLKSQNDGPELHQRKLSSILISDHRIKSVRGNRPQNTKKLVSIN